MNGIFLIIWILIVKIYLEIPIIIVFKFKNYKTDSF